MKCKKNNKTNIPIQSKNHPQPQANNSKKFIKFQRNLWFHNLFQIKATNCFFFFWVIPLSLHEFCKPCHIISIKMRHHWHMGRKIIWKTNQECNLWFFDHALLSVLCLQFLAAIDSWYRLMIETETLFWSAPQLMLASLFILLFKTSDGSHGEPQTLSLGRVVWRDKYAMPRQNTDLHPC